MKTAWGISCIHVNRGNEQLYYMCHRLYFCWLAVFISHTVCITCITIYRTYGALYLCLVRGSLVVAANIIFYSHIFYLPHIIFVYKTNKLRFGFTIIYISYSNRSDQGAFHRPLVTLFEHGKVIRIWYLHAKNPRPQERHLSIAQM